MWFGESQVLLVVQVTLLFFPMNLELTENRFESAVVRFRGGLKEHKYHVLD